MNLTDPPPWLDGHPLPKPGPIDRDGYDHGQWLRAAQDPTTPWPWLAYLGAHCRGYLEWNDPQAHEVPCAALANPNLTQRAASYVLQAHGEDRVTGGGRELDARLVRAFAGNPIVTLWTLDELAWPRHLSGVALEALCLTPEAVAAIGPSLGAACLSVGVYGMPNQVSPIANLRDVAEKIGGRALRYHLLGDRMGYLYGDDD